MKKENNSNVWYIINNHSYPLSYTVTTCDVTFNIVLTMWRSIPMRAKVFGIVLVLLSHVNLLFVLIGLLWCFLCSDWVLRLLLFLIDDFQ